jgi:hypothetical protein
MAAKYQEGGRPQLRRFVLTLYHQAQVTVPRLAALLRSFGLLNTNGSENDTRCQATKRKISSGTRSDAGRDCRDAFLGLAKTCTKLGIAFWDYLGARLAIPGQPDIPYLPEIVRDRCASA